MKLSIVLCFFLLLLPLSLAQLKVGFYKSSCPKAESIVKQVVQKRFNRDRTITAALLRLHFHDCFVRGCDASILIDSAGDNEAEKDADQNFSVRGYDLIEEAKERVEEACPSTVSCADIITIATRDAVALSGGPQYKVPTGRRDGVVSRKSEVDLPEASISVVRALDFFGRKGIRREEMVSLIGGHTVGVTGSTPLDPETPFTVDNEFYKGILKNRGVFPIDRELAVAASTRGIVTRFAANNATFETSFANAMIKMGRIQVLLGKAGEIRDKCNAFNN